MIPGSATPLLLKKAAADTGYNIERSLRFNSADSAYLSRTPASAGNRKTWTWAGWVKRSKLSSNMPIFGTDYLGASYCSLYFDSNNTLFFENYSGGFQARLQTTQVFRDPSAWLHIVVALDTTQATAANRAKIYVNGSEVTALTIATYPSQNTDLLINNNQYHEISQSNSTYTFGGYLADIHFIDGQALTPSSFTEVSATTGQLIPKAYTGTFGTNGFWLKFSDNSAATATTLGKDYSSNGNNWTPNNLSVTAGAGNDSLVDTPTSYGTGNSGGDVRGNFCTWSPLDAVTNSTLSNGNLDITNTGDGAQRIGSMGVSSGKWYYEFVQTTNATAQPGINSRRETSTFDTRLMYYINGQKYNGATGSAYGATWTTNDVIGIALDLDAGTLIFYKNGVSQGTAFTGLSGTYYPWVRVDTSGSVCVANFGQRPFAYPVSGYKAWCDTNLPAPVVAKSASAFDVLTWTGTGGNRTFTGLGFSPDLVWGKGRNAAYNHQLYDVVRGTGSSKDLASNLTNAEGSAGVGAAVFGYISAFNSDGFSTTGGSSDNSYWNGSSTTYAAWCWDAGTTTSSNVAGSITSSVRANASAGFSIVTYTGSNSTASTVGHGLGVIPGMVIVKNRTGTGYQWRVWHSYFGASTTKTLLLSATNGEISGSTDGYITGLTSTVFGFGGGTAAVNASSTDYVAYCFAPVAGYSTGSSYTGNGSADGPFVYCGFKPRLILIKNTTSGSTNNWVLFDTARNTYNETNLQLWPNSSNGGLTYEATNSNVPIDILSNGFKVRSTGGDVNTSTNVYIFFAWAENPFAYARAR